MSITVDIGDEVSPWLDEVQSGLEARGLAPAIGRAEVGLFQRWLIENPPNRKGWPSTRFWSRAARATNFSMQREGVMISINEIGMRQRYFGGTILPTEGHKYLTIPARPEAYGKRAGEFSDLVLAFFKGKRGLSLALVQAESQEVKFGPKRKDGSRKVDAGEERGGGVFFWLVKSVTQRGNEHVIPPDNLILGTAMEVIGDAIARLKGELL